MKIQDIDLSDYIETFSLFKYLQKWNHNEEKNGFPYKCRKKDYDFNHM